MGRKSTRENKTIYQLLREECGMTREEASEAMPGVSSSHIEKIEYEQMAPTPYDVVMMAQCYGRPDLCNYYCTHECAIGKKYIPEVQLNDLESVVLKTVANLNNVAPEINRMIQITADGKISDDEIRDFARISKTLDNIALYVNELNLWIDKTTGENEFNKELFDEEKSKLG